MTSKTARRRRRAAKSSSKNGPGARFAFGLPGGFRLTTHLATVQFIALAKPFTMFFIHIADNGLKINWLALACILAKLRAKNQNSSLNTYRYGSCAYSFSGGCSDQSYAFYSLQYLRLP